MLDLAFARGHVQGFISPLDMAGLESHRMDAVDANMAMVVVGVAVNGQHVLMFGQAKCFEGVFGGVEHVVGRRAFVLWPAQDDVIGRVLATRIFLGDGIHFGACRGDAVDALRADGETLFCFGAFVDRGAGVIQDVVELVR